MKRRSLARPAFGVLSLAACFVNGHVSAAQTFPLNPVKAVEAPPKQQPRVSDRSVYFVGVHRYSHGDYYGALDAFKRFIPLADATTLGDTYSYMGDAWSAIGDYPNAIAVYTKYLLAHPGDTTNTALLHRRLAYQKLDRNAEASKDLEAWRVSHPEDPRLARLRELTAAVSNDPCDFALRNSLAKLEIDLKDFQGALEQYIAITTATPGDATAIYNRGTTYELLRDNTKALVDLATYTRLKPADASGWNILGIYLAIAKDYKGSIAAFTRCIALLDAQTGKPFAPEFNEIYENRGADYYCVQQWTNAYADFAQYLAAHPEDYRLKEALARVAKGDDFDEDLAALHRVVKSAPGMTDTNAWYNLGIGYLGKKSYEDATVAFARSNDLKADPQTLFNRALSFYNLGVAGNAAALEKAEKDAAAALAMKPDYPDALLVKADTELARHEDASARADYLRYAGLPGVSKENKAYAEKRAAGLP